MDDAQLDAERKRYGELASYALLRASDECLNVLIRHGFKLSSFKFGTENFLDFIMRDNTIWSTEYPPETTRIYDKDWSITVDRIKRVLKCLGIPEEHYRAFFSAEKMTTEHYDSIAHADGYDVYTFTQTLNRKGFLNYIAKTVLAHVTPDSPLMTEIKASATTWGITLDKPQTQALVDSRLITTSITAANITNESTSNAKESIASAPPAEDSKATSIIPIFPTEADLKAFLEFLADSDSERAKAPSAPPEETHAAPAAPNPAPIANTSTVLAPVLTFDENPTSEIANSSATAAATSAAFTFATASISTTLPSTTFTTNDFPRPPSDEPVIPSQQGTHTATPAL